MYMDKVKNFCDHSMILWEMAANQKPTGHFWTTPASFRVKRHFFTTPSYYSIACATDIEPEENKLSFQLILHPKDEYFYYQTTQEQKKKML